MSGYWKHYPDAPHPNPYDETGPPDPDDLCMICEKLRCECEEETKWNCPKCGQSNVDYFAQTTFPLCENCGATFHWDEILPPEQDEQPTTERQ